MPTFAVRTALAMLVCGGAIAAAGLAVGAEGAEAQSAVARVGDRVVTAAEVKKALAGVPAFELQALGSTRSDILKKYVDEAIVREELLAEAARRRGALDDRATQIHLRKALAGAVVRRELASIGGRSDIPDADVRAYYDAHITELRTPERVRVWHIVVATKPEADAALARVKADPTREAWPKIVSEVSLDPNTKRSNGDLGFVTADGLTGEPRIVVPKEIAAEAFKLKDGEIAPTAVKSEAGWHVVWRRGSVPATVRSLKDEDMTIRELLYEQKRKKTYDAVLERVRVAAKPEVDEALLPLVSVDVGPRAIPRPGGGRK